MANFEWEFMADLRGVRGLQGVTGKTGAQGLPGMNAAPADEAVAGYLGTEGVSATRVAADKNFTRANGTTIGEALADGITGALTVALTGHSLAYGQDGSDTGTLPPANGASQTRSFRAPTEQMARMARHVRGFSVTVINQGYPGDQSIASIERWESGTSGNIEFFWVDTNEINNFAARPTGQLTDEQMIENLVFLINRARARGSEVVVCGGAPTRDYSTSIATFAAAEAQRGIAERMGAVWVDMGDLIAGIPRAQPLFTDNVHLTISAYTAAGTRLAAFCGPRGLHPIRVAPGRIISARDMAFTGVELPTRAGSVDGRTIRPTPLSDTKIAALAVMVDAPCTPVIRFRTQGVDSSGMFGQIRAGIGLGETGRRSRNFELKAGNNPTGTLGAFTYVRMPDLLTPGPEAITIESVTNRPEIDAVLFLPVVNGTIASGGYDSEDRYLPLQLHPVGGQALRKDDTWDGMVDIRSGISCVAGGDLSGTSPTRWTFDVALSPLAGVMLVQGFSDENGRASDQGYHFLRSGTSLVIRRYSGGIHLDTTVPNVFPSATGVIRTVLEVQYRSDHQMYVFVDGNAVGAPFAPGYTFYMAGLIAGPVGNYAAGTGSVWRHATNEYL
jgi:hypothetical protein